MKGVNLSIARWQHNILYDLWPSHETITTDSHYWGQICPNFVSVKTEQLVHFPCLHRQTDRQTLYKLMPPIKKMNHTHQQATCSGVLDAMREYMKRE